MDNSHRSPLAATPIWGYPVSMFGCCGVEYPVLLDPVAPNLTSPFGGPGLVIIWNIVTSYQPLPRQGYRPGPLRQGLLFGLSKGGFKVSSGTAECLRSSYGTDFDNSETASLYSSSRSSQAVDAWRQRLPGEVAARHPVVGPSSSGVKGARDLGSLAYLAS